MDNQGHYCNVQPALNSFYATRDGDKCMSRFQCLSGTNASLNGLEFNCMCDVLKDHPKSLDMKFEVISMQSEAQLCMLRTGVLMRLSRPSLGVQ